MPQILKNRVKCLLCNTVIESKTVNDYVTCPCGTVAVCGGTYYNRVTYLQQPDKSIPFENMCIVLPDASGKKNESLEITGKEQDNNTSESSSYLDNNYS